jgi:hypothetical protein
MANNGEQALQEITVAPHRTTTTTPWPLVRKRTIPTERPLLGPQS